MFGKQIQTTGKRGGSGRRRLFRRQKRRGSCRCATLHHLECPIRATEGDDAGRGEAEECCCVWECEECVLYEILTTPGVLEDGRGEGETGGEEELETGFFAAGFFCTSVALMAVDGEEEEGGGGCALFPPPPPILTIAGAEELGGGDGFDDDNEEANTLTVPFVDDGVDGAVVVLVVAAVDDNGDGEEEIVGTGELLGE